jgi:hypothetical protein
MPGLIVECFVLPPLYRAEYITSRMQEGWWHCLELQLELVTSHWSISWSSGSIDSGLQVLSLGMSISLRPIDNPKSRSISCDLGLSRISSTSMWFAAQTDYHPLWLVRSTRLLGQSSPSAACGLVQVGARLAACSACASLRVHGLQSVTRKARRFFLRTLPLTTPSHAGHPPSTWQCMFPDSLCDSGCGATSPSSMLRLWDENAFR